MQTYHRLITMCRWVGIAPVTRKNIEKNVKGDDYVFSKTALIFYIIQIITLYWMVDQFKAYIQQKHYYSKEKMFQVSVIMYCEVLQSLMVVMFSCIFRFPNLETLSRKFKCVLKDLNEKDIHFLLRHFGVMSVLWNTLFTVYRTKTSLRRQKMMLPFWLGMNQIILLKSLLLLLLSMVDASYKKINKELRKILDKPAINPKQLQIVLFQMINKHQRASNLLVVVLKDFGPDVLSMCLFFLFKVTFVVYHLNVSVQERMWGNNTLLGELTGYIQILQLIVNIFSLVYVTDSLFELKKETHTLLLTLTKNLPQRSDRELMSTIKTLILQVKSHPNGFNVCSHFEFTRALLYDMLWGALTYVFVLIQFQGIKT